MSSFPFYTLSNMDLPTLAVWQRAIDELDLISRATLLSVEIGAGQRCAMQFEHKSALFSCTRAAPDTVLGERYASYQGIWSFAYGFDDFGKHIEMTASAIACVSYALATGGAFFKTGDPPIRGRSRLRRLLDVELAYSLRLEDAYFDRYPDERQVYDQPPVERGPDRLEIILHRGRPR